MAFVLLLMNLAGACLALPSAVVLFFVFSEGGFLDNVHFRVGMALVGILTGAIGGILPAIGTWLSLRGRSGAGFRGAALCWFGWVVAGAFAAQLEDHALHVIPAVAAGSWVAALVARARTSAATPAPEAR